MTEGPAAICMKASEKIFKGKPVPALGQRSIGNLSAALQCTRLGESYPTISCSIHERAIMEKKRSARHVNALHVLPEKLQQCFFPQEGGGERREKK